MNKIKSFLDSKPGFPFLKVYILLLILFLIWGFALGLLDILTTNFQSVLQSNASISGLILLTYYVGYLLMPIPASIFTNRFGYKKGIILGLLLFAFGAFMFIPNSHFQSSTLFLFSMFCIALGMAALETVVNLYTILIGKNNLSAFRITLGQSFTSLGWFFGPFVAGSILLEQKHLANPFDFIQLPYVGVGILVVFVAILISISELPKINATSSQLPINDDDKSQSLFSQRHFVAAIVAMAFYICAQTALFGFFTQYLLDIFKSMETVTVVGHNLIQDAIRLFGNTNQLNDKVYSMVAQLIFIFGGMGLLTLGRFIGSIILIKIKVNHLLIITSVFSLFFSILMWLNLGLISIVALCLISLSMSVMFPLIFSLGIRKLGKNTNRASAYLIMAITGGSVYPILINIFDTINPVNIGLTLLFISFIVILFYSLIGYKIVKKI